MDTADKNTLPEKPAGEKAVDTNTLPKKPAGKKRSLSQHPAPVRREMKRNGELGRRQKKIKHRQATSMSHKLVLYVDHFCGECQHDLSGLLDHYCPCSHDDARRMHDHFCPCGHLYGEKDDHWCPCVHTLGR
ncbi:hypothetical protein F5Y14DRAFT_411061, partial [Nemania sp. NC0429]